eukprot:scaffold192529_cov23-Tisochrysis_lutea.AAC.2
MLHAGAHALHVQLLGARLNKAQSEAQVLCCPLISSTRLMYMVCAGTRALHVQLLGALNIAGSGAQVLRTSVAACLEFFLTTRRAQAQGFEMALPAGYQAALQASAGVCFAF